MSVPSGHPFVRYPTTWLAYFMLAYVTYAPGMLGPLMPYIRTEQSLTYTLGGFLPSTLALGMVTAGMTGDRIAHKLGRRFVFWAGGTGSAVGAVCLALSHQVLLTHLAVLIMGFCGSLSLVMIQAILSDLYGEQRAIPLTESNLAASLSSSLAPLLVGGFQRVGIGWRGAPLLAVVILGLIAARFHQAPIPDALQAITPSGSPHRQALPYAYWAYWIVIILVVSVEWCLIVWSADFLESVVGLTRINASTTVSVFLLAMVLGRVASSRLARVMSGHSLLLIALAVTLVGFPIFWLAKFATLNIAGLFVAGLGVANLFPLTMSAAVGTASQQSNVASARVSLGTGLAILTAPLLLGWTADQISLHNAFGIVAALITLSAAVTFVTYRVSIRRGAIGYP